MSNIHCILLESRYFDKSAINMIIQYYGGLIYTFMIKFKKEKISVIKELDDNRLMIGFCVGDVCLYNLSDGTMIRKNLIKNPKKKNISALCYIPTINKIVCGLTGYNSLILWDYVNNKTTEIKITFDIFDIINVKDNIIMCIEKFRDIYKVCVLNIESLEKITEFYTEYLSKTNDKIIEITCDMNICVSPIDSLFKIKKYLTDKTKLYLYAYIKRVITSDEKNYIIVKNNCIAIKNIETLTESEYIDQYSDGIIISEECWRDIICVNTNVIVLIDNKVKVFDLTGVLIQIIEYDDIIFIKKHKNGLLIVDKKANIFVYY